MAENRLTLRFTAQNDATKTFNDMKRSLNGIESSVGNLQKVLAGLFIADRFKDAAGAVLSFSGQLEQASVAFTVMTGSAQRAAQHLAALKEFARQTPFAFTDLVEGSKRLQAFGVEAEQVIPTLTTLGNITAGVGREKLPQLILALGQTIAATKLTGNELRQFTEAGVPLLSQLAKQYGVTVAAMKEFVEDGRISADGVRFALDELAQTQFADLMVKQSKTFDGALTNIQDSALQLSATALEPLFLVVRDGTVAFADFLSTADMGAWAAKASNDIRGVTGTLGGLLAGLGQVKDAIAGLQNRVGQGVDLPGWAQLVTRQISPLAGAILDMGKAQEKASVAIAEMTEEFDANYELMLTALPVAENTAAVADAVATSTGRIPPPLLDVASAAKKAAGGVKEAALSLEELLNKTLALEAAMPFIRELVSTGGLLDAANALVTLGESAQSAISKVIGLRDEIAREAERAAEEAAREAKRLADEAAAAAKRMADEWKERSDQMARSIIDALKAGKDWAVGTADFFRNEWLASLEERIKEVAQNIRNAMRDGLDISRIVADALPLFEAYKKAQADIAAQADAVRKAEQDLADQQRKNAEMSQEWVRQMKETADFVFERDREARRERTEELMFGKSIRELQHDADVVLGIERNLRAKQEAMRTRNAMRDVATGVREGLGRLFGGDIEGGGMPSWLPALANTIIKLEQDGVRANIDGKDVSRQVSANQSRSSFLLSAMGGI